MKINRSLSTPSLPRSPGNFFSAVAEQWLRFAWLCSIKIRTKFSKFRVRIIPIIFRRCLLSSLINVSSYLRSCNGLKIFQSSIEDENFLNSDTRSCSKRFRWSNCKFQRWTVQSRAFSRGDARISAEMGRPIITRRKVAKSRWRARGFFRVPENLFRTPWPPPWNVITGWIMWAILGEWACNLERGDGGGMESRCDFTDVSHCNADRGRMCASNPGKTLQQSNLPFSFIINRPRVPALLISSSTLIDLERLLLLSLIARVLIKEELSFLRFFFLIKSMNFHNTWMKWLIV